MLRALTRLMAVTQRRKLLTAAVGVATVSYVVACGGLGLGGQSTGGQGGAETSGNLVAAGGFTSPSDPNGYGGAETSGNLVAAGGFSPTPEPSGYGGGETSGNLLAPPPGCPCDEPDSGTASEDVDAGPTHVVTDAGTTDAGGD